MKYNSLAAADVTVTFHSSTSFACSQVIHGFDRTWTTLQKLQTMGWTLSDESGGTRRQWSENVAVETSTIFLRNREVTGCKFGPTNKLSGCKLRDIPKFLQANTGIVPQIRPNPLPFIFFQFTIIFLQLSYRCQIKKNNTSVACCTYGRRKLHSEFWCGKLK